jgi:putative glutamine amidotransferase
MAPRIAIPVPHSGDPDYAARSLPQYERAVKIAGGEPVRIPLDQSPSETMKLIDRCDAVLLPGSKADVDPAKYKAQRSPQTAASDPGRDTVDWILLDDAYDTRKPILGICYGLQSLNVYRSGTLIQHIESPVPHAAGRAVAVAHTVEVEPESKLAKIIGFEKTHDRAEVPVNSSHHQAADTVGKGLRVSARSAQDGIIEGLEGTSADHFVLAVQWHPERSVDEDEPSRAIFQALVDAARVRQEKRELESV